jgi:hypothetical protein
MQSIYYGGLIYFKVKLDIIPIKDGPSFWDNCMLLKKQSLGVCKRRDQYGSSGVTCATILRSSLFLDSSWCGVPLFPVKKN